MNKSVRKQIEGVIGRFHIGASSSVMDAISIRYNIVIVIEKVKSPILLSLPQR